MGTRYKAGTSTAGSSIPPLPKTTRVAHETKDSRGLPTISRSQHECSVPAPYRLDLTVTALRRLSANVVDVLTPAIQPHRDLKIIACRILDLTEQ